MKYDEVNDLDRHREWRLTIETPTTRILASTLITATNRLFITEGENALNLPPPGQFHVSLQILNQEGVRIRQLTYIAAPEDEIAPISEKANALEAQRLTALVSGTWRNPAGGSCQAAYFKSGERNRTKRNEEAMAGTVTNAGTTIAGQLILAGAREGQFINPMTDKAIFLFENKPNEKLTFTAIGEPAAGWPEVTLELCPGTRSAEDAAGGKPTAPIPGERPSALVRRNAGLSSQGLMQSPPICGTVRAAPNHREEPSCASSASFPRSWLRSCPAAPPPRCGRSTSTGTISSRSTCRANRR